MRNSAFMQPKTVAMASDHAGYEMKDALKAYVESKGISVIDLGTNGPESVDYPKFGDAIADALIMKSFTESLNSPFAFSLSSLRAAKRLSKTHSTVR